MKRFGLLLGVALIAGCAKQGMPPGGPEDRTPPRVMENLPAAEALGVPLDTPVELHFSESIQAKVPEEAVFITPYPGKEVKVRIKGRTLRVQFPASLKPDRTYVVTVGTAVTDLRGNALAQSHTLAFSTGDHLDQGRLTGRVFGQDDASGIDVWAYRLGEDGDDLDRDPDYIVQCGKDGAFAFSHVAPGRYRLLAVQDRLADRRYQPVEDLFGATFRDAVLSDSTAFSAQGLNFRLTQEDTLRPTLLAADPIHGRAVRLRFDKPIDPASLSALRLAVQGDPARDVEVEDCFREPANPQNLYLRHAPVAAGQTLRILALGLRDTLGLALDTAFAEASWTVTGLADTTAPKLVAALPKPGQRNMTLLPRIRLDFTEPMDTSTFSGQITLCDSSDRVVPSRFLWDTPFRLMCLPQTRLAGRMAFRLDLSGGWVGDASGNALADTVLRWTTLNPDTLSEISGAVWDADPQETGAIWVRARAAAQDGPAYGQWIEGPGDYRLEGVLPGLYVLECFRDRDGNGRYGHGCVHPYLPAERFRVRQDTLKVRARWPNEGNDLLLQ